MSKGIQFILEMLEETYDGDPWFGRSIKKILADIDAEVAVQKPMSQHSILELLYHMINWREFTISRIEPRYDKTSSYFGENDWITLDHKDIALWERGLELLDDTQIQLISHISNMDEDKLNKRVPEREYDFRFLLYGLIQHDIYHLGQIAYVMKMLS